ncbi:MAG: hypothetical protein AAGB12_08645 [Pseudomonadota bacterium]
MNWKPFIVIISGLAIGHLSVYLTGYLAAIAIPQSYFDWFNENVNSTAGYITLLTAQLFLSPGVFIFLAVCGLMFSKQANGIASIILFYVTLWVYNIFGLSLIYGGSLMPFDEIFTMEGLIYLVISLGMLTAGYLFAKKFRQSDDNAFL